jgi:hypothetical protein
MSMGTVMATARVMADGGGDGRRRWQLRWPTVTAMVMTDSNGDGNG